MPYANFKIVKCTQSNAHSETDCSKHPCFLSADTVNSVTANYPIAAPTSDAMEPSFSYENWLRLECTSPPDNYCQNFKFWGPMYPPDYPLNKIDILVGCTGTGMTPRVDTVNAIASTSLHSNYYSEGTALDWLVSSADGKIKSVGDKSKYLVVQLRVQYQAEWGNIETQTFNVQYEES